MRLIDSIFRQGHMSEQALFEALTAGERPRHLDQCDICSERAVELSRWLDTVQHDGIDAADAVFSADKLTVQQAQILRRLEQVDNPARVIAFPAAGRSEREAGGRRVAASWVGVAAAAGLIIGVVGGQLSARLTQPPAAPQVAQNIDDRGPIDSKFLDQSYDQLSLSPFEALDEVTPKLTSPSTTRTGK